MTSIERGWYFYGITRRAPLAAVLAAAGDTHEPLQLLEFSGLAAVVRPVSLADFARTALQERLQNAAALETMVRSHNRVIETIHAQQAILPAKFGMVHARAEEVVTSLRVAHDSLLHQLSRLEACDEWAIHLFADREAARERISTADSAVRRLREECSTARPGRAYFLAQQLRDELEAATERSLTTIAQSAFDRLAVHAADGQMIPLVAAADLATELEILRASFLVKREGAERFHDAVSSCIDIADGLRCECSGPWPPYSFTVQDDELEAE